MSLCVHVFAITNINNKSFVASGASNYAKRLFNLLIKLRCAYSYVSLAFVLSYGKYGRHSVTACQEGFYHVHTQ